MTTTFEKFNGTPRGNYCTLPTIDVEILELQPVCDQCEAPVIWNPKAQYGFGGYEHSTETECPYRVSVRPTCRYCGTSEKGVVTYRQYAYYDATECSRCGGISGYAIGD